MICSVGVVGGGTAGYLTALALRRRFPDLTIEVITAPDIPVIGVGESTVFQIVDFLHGDLEVDVADFYRAVRPTWKLGVRFRWGPRERGWFNFPFQRVPHHLAHHHHVDLKGSTWYGTLMDARKSFLVPSAAPGGRPRAVKPGAYAYHLENRSLIAYLRDRVPSQGITLTDARIVEAVPHEDRSGVRELRTADGRSFHHDFWVDCSGFRSILLERALGARWVDFSSSLPTDRAIIGSAPNGGRPVPYTESVAMPSGWIWRTPMCEEDHFGYVFSSAFASDDEAAAVLSREFGVATPGGVVPFQTGRHDRAWVGNVVAIGNASAFVEPLQASGIQMIVAAIRGVLRALPDLVPSETEIARYNQDMAAKWDFLRGFLALHYAHNTGGDSPFWDMSRSELELGPFQGLVEYFQTCGLHSAPDSRSPEEFRGIWDAGVFGPHGVDLMLLGLGVKPGGWPLPSGPAMHRFQGKRALWRGLATAALMPEEAFELAVSEPGLVWPR